MKIKKMPALMAGVAGMVLLLSSCEASRSLYSWYSYEDASYRAMKTRSEEDTNALIATYKKIIERQLGSRRTVPPGIYAEYALVLIKQNKVEEGIEMFEKEMELYPESKKYISRIVEQYKKR
ncbi:MULTISPECIES: DUF4810 domain-containing protein [Porphyromonas]|uniref:DUF4810 domain-containing protein n=1 Tax=Porphyromonas TaxID=836 RepID=UPI00068BCB60|nr:MULTISPECIES: DUF4810 domain-containing protein [Porphyromonas]